MTDGSNTINREPTKQVLQKPHPRPVPPTSAPVAHTQSVEDVARQDAEQAFHARISLAAEQAYLEVGKERGIDPNYVFSSRSCDQVSDALARTLVQNGEKVVRLTNFGVSFVPGIKGVDSHEFLAVKGPDGKTQIVDPTWQQFLEAPNDALPRVLQVPVEKLEETAESYGIPRGEAQRVAWLRRVEQGIDFNEKPDE